MWQYVGQSGDVEVRILLHARADHNAAEADKEIDGRPGFEIAHAVADERGLAMRARPDVAHGELLSARACEKRAAIEVFVVAVRVKHQRHSVYVSPRDVQRVGERKDGLFDTGGDEMDDYTGLLQR